MGRGDAEESSQGGTLPPAPMLLLLARLSASSSFLAPPLLALSLCAPLSHSPLWSLGSRKAPPPGGPRNYGEAPGVCRGRGPHPQCGFHCLSVSLAAEEPAGDGWGRVSVDKPILCPPNTAPSCSSPARAAAEAPALVRGSGLPHRPAARPHSLLLTSLVVQTVKTLPAVQETWVRSLGWEDPLEEGMATHSSILAWRIPMDRGAWWATVHGAAESDVTEQLHFYFQHLLRELHDEN